MSQGLFRTIAAVLAAMGCLMLAIPTQAQNSQSDQYKFLKAVKDRDGTVATQMLSQPGNTVIHARDISTGQTALHIAAERRDATWVKFLAQRGANPNTPDRNGVTPLQIASNLGDVATAAALLDAGAQTDITNDTGETPLIIATHRRDTGMVHILLAAGANPDRTDNAGRSARDYAREIGSTRLLDEFEQTDSKQANGPAYGPTIR